MAKYKVSVDFGEDGYNSYTNIFGVIALVIKESGNAKVTVTRL